MVDRLASDPQPVAGIDGDLPDSPHRHFRLSAPRHFVYPAILLLLSEKPRHGYTLMDPLAGLGFGPVDRPTVYRALSELEHDGLLRSWSAEPKAGATRHVYAPTDAGRRALEDWMAILGGERDRLDVVLERYAALAYGPNAGLLGSDAPATWPAPRRLTKRGAGPITAAMGPTAAERSSRLSEKVRETYKVVAAHSAVLIRARSNVGPIEFGSNGIEGTVGATVSGGRLIAGQDLVGELAVAVASLTSGNALYDNELRHRIDARLFPTAQIGLDDVEALESEDRLGVRGHMTFHGVTQRLYGVVGVQLPGEDRIVVTGEHVIDIRDFGVSAPKRLQLKIYPDVRVYLHLEAEAIPWD